MSPAGWTIFFRDSSKVPFRYSASGWMRPSPRFVHYFVAAQRSSNVSEVLSSPAR